MNKDELKKLIDGLDDNTQIIIINTRDEAKQIPRELVKDCPRITVKDKVVVYWKKFRNGVAYVAAVWIFSLGFFPEITPTPIKVAEVAYENMQPLLAQWNWDAPHSQNIAAFPYLEYKGQIVLEKFSAPVPVKYMFPPSGFNSVAITANTNIQPYPPFQSGNANI